ncbi:MAG: T9SS type A sorting domain-containing protein [Saprospiraceae bacterium]
MVKFDSSGNILNSTIILDSLGDKLSVDKTWGKIIATSDGGFAMTAATVFRESAFLIKTDGDFNVEFVKEYPDTVNLSNFDYKLFEIPDGYILYGNIQRPNFLLQPFVRKVDKKGNTIWFNYYGITSVTNTFIDGGGINDSLYVFTGVRNGPTVDLGRSILIYLDSNGVVTNSWLSEPWSDIGFIRKMKVLEGGDLLLFSQYLHDYKDNKVLFKPTISRMTPTFEFKWIKRYGRIDRFEAYVLFWDMEPLSGNEFIGAGQSRVEVNGEKEQSGWLMKFNTEGDSIWSRYNFPDFPVDSLGDTFFGGVGVLSSGSIVAGGTATLWNEQAIWLLKVTNDGCMKVINCGLVPVVEREEEKEDLKIFPNPANQYLTVSLNERSTSPGKISFYGFDGRLVLQKEYAVGEKEVLIDTSGLPVGLYAVQKMAAGLAFEVGKVIISH